MWPRSKQGKALDSANTKPPRYNERSINDEGGEPVPRKPGDKPPKPNKSKLKVKRGLSK